MDFREVIDQINYDSGWIKTNLSRIKKNEEKMKQWIGKPIYNSTKDHNEKMKEENEAHRKNIITHSKLL